MNTIELIKDKHNKPAFDRMRTLLKCISSDPTRDVIGKLKVEQEDDAIRLIATDGRRLRTDLFEMKAEPGLYDVKTNTAKMIFLAKSDCELTFPNWKQVMPNPKAAWSFTGTGRNFVIWASSGLGCLIDPDLIALGDHETVTLSIQKDCPELSPVLLKNDTTSVVIMPLRLKEPWIEQIQQIRAKAA